MTAGTRIVSEEPRTLYPGDVVEGALAAQQVAAGNAVLLPGSEPQPEAKVEPQPELAPEPEPAPAAKPRKR